MSKPFSFFCLGSMDCFPKAGNDSSSFLLDGHILIDTGVCDGKRSAKSRDRPDECRYDPVHPPAF
ncbi:MAG: hypothetical protein KBS76_03175 [Ruminococcus sp.]|nr:hypothetical protein [Candidatus Apopatosoma intestinale]